MDPNATLARIRELCRGHVLDADEAAELAELITVLDGWLSRGGSMPTAWQHYPADRPTGRNPRPVF